MFSYWLLFSHVVLVNMFLSKILLYYLKNIPLPFKSSFQVIDKKIGRGTVAINTLTLSRK